ncbi:alpha-2-macroglobulin-like [Lampris incognitus]|uniref:alpha-2-macroglobulin-like n=1 Tax=Lampris incognitus TaxID=2546036 RepID=UPI0024B4F7E6|nr:alpha-2-macroglobulin-like [Lampris incognitus]
MALSGLQMWRWILVTCLSCIFTKQVVAEPHYMVAIPAVMEAGSEAKFCASLMQQNELLDMIITLISEEGNVTLLEESTSTKFHKCVQFKAPSVKTEQIQKFEVYVRGQTFQSREVRKVLFRPYNPLTFVQTDKPIYLPGQTVQFRVISMDSTFVPVNELYDIIEIKDVHENRIGQWLNKTSGGKILQLSHSLISEPPEGTYHIIVRAGDSTTYHNFKVEKYVLPKFDVQIHVPKEVSISQEELKADVCATYTFKQPVPANVVFEVCRPMQRYVPLIIPEHPERILGISPPCLNESKQLNEDGCATFTVPIAIFTKTHKFLKDILFLTAEVKEEGTDIKQSQGKTISLSHIIGRLSFIDTPKVYEQGSLVEGKVKVVYFNRTPIPNHPVYLSKSQGWLKEHIQNLTTDSDGIASFSLNTTGSTGDIMLIASSEVEISPRQYNMPYYENGEHTISLARIATPETKTVSSLEVVKSEKPLLCNEFVDVTIRYWIVGETKGPVDVLYLILSHGTIFIQGVVEAQVQDDSVTEKEVSIKFQMKPEMAPLVQVVAYAVLPSDTVIAHSANFDTEKCFVNKVSVAFFQSLAVPGERSSMQVSALQGSLCGLSAVDQSVHIKAPGKKLDADKIFDLLPIKAISHIPYEVQDDSPCLPVRQKRYVLPYPGHGKDDPYTVFQNLGLKMVTDLHLKLPSCLLFKGRTYQENYVIVADRHLYRTSMHQSMPGVGGGLSRNSFPSPIETQRSFFPETWIWDLVEVGHTGTKDVSFTVPDTITTWETEAFCLSPEGFGLATPQELRVYQPFFMELSLPYSVVRGETFELIATIFNYQSNTIVVSVTPTTSTDYTLTPLVSREEDQFCLYAKQRNVMKWKMTPTTLGIINVTVKAEASSSQAFCNNEIVEALERGRIDTVTRSLIVKAEGIEQTKTHNWLMCPNGHPLTEETELQLPENMIDGSVRISVSVLGDILGRALKNLDGLLQMPYGCGEQNMALLAPNIYIMEYLNNTQQLTAAISEKAKNFLVSGYQRQLNYKHNNGAYSTFGTGVGNTWLTAFVMRSFVRAKSFIFIDQSNIDDPKHWLEHEQKPSGCFRMLGHLFNNRMKGGVSNELTLTAYVTAAFLEMNIPPSHAVIQNSLSCLKNSTIVSGNNYYTALMAYVFTLAGEKETRTKLLQQLHEVASEEGGLIHWKQSSEETSYSLSVEISSYVLLATLSTTYTTEDLGYASRIVRWLVRQQNSYGGFSSTQDTVVALQALSLYATLVFSEKGSSTVMIHSPSGQLTFVVDQSNKLLYQERELQDATGKYRLEVDGTACTSIQMTQRFNIPTPTDVNNISIQVKTETDCTSTSLRPKLTLKLKSLYNGKETPTNMVIIDIKMLSGFVPDPNSLKLLKRSVGVDRVEYKDDHVFVYITRLHSGIPINHTLDIVQEIVVNNLKPAVIQIYDYYHTSDQSEMEYNYPCVTGN